MKNKRNKFNRLLTICMTLLIVFSVMFTAAGTTENVQAASGGLGAYKKITFYKSGKVNGTTYSMKYNSRTHRYIVYAAKNGKKKAVLKSCSSGTIVTNGKYLYYESAAFLRSGNFGGTFRKRKLVQYNLKTGKNKVLISFKGEGPVDSIIGCDGTYLYMGYQTQYGDGMGNFAVVNLKKRQVKRLEKDCSTVQKVKNRVLVTAVGFPHGGPVYLINRDGSKCKTICSRAIKVSVKGNYIYYTEATYDWKTRKCRCDLNGNNKKALTSWSRGIAG